MIIKPGQLEHQDELQHLPLPDKSPELNTIKPRWTVLERRERSIFRHPVSVIKLTDILIDSIKLSRFINPMLPSLLVLVVYVCVSVCGRADSSALINDPVDSIIIIISCSSPLSHLLCQIVVCESRLCLISSSFQSCAFFVPVRVPVDSSLWIRHVTSALLFTALGWPSKSLRHYPVSLWTAPIIISIGLIKREPTRILFPRFYHNINSI